jgi:23S rRNA (guanine745-N1)-methyltransferase
MPHCKHRLDADGTGFRCVTGHHFDRAAEGYVNLLPGGRKKSRPSGDAREMVSARRSVFDAGHFGPVVKAVASMVMPASSVLDAGCGEGSLLGAIDAKDRFGIDISKDAVRIAARRWKTCTFAVASAYDLPFYDRTFDRVVSVFAPQPFTELQRVLSFDGEIVVASPAHDHLDGITALLYGTPRYHDDAPPGPIADDVTRVRYALHLDVAHAIELLRMTPYWWKTDARQRRALAGVSEVDTTIDVWVRRYRL